MIQITDPIVIAAVIPAIPVFPKNFKSIVEKSRVAIAIPETGLLELPTSPTIREDTVAKKKPNTTMRSAPGSVTGITGITHMRMTTTRIPPNTTAMGRSSFCSPSFSRFPYIRTASPNVLIIRGNVFKRLMIPPAATAPAPI